MTTFKQFLDTCREEENHLQQNVKTTFERGWKPLFEEFRKNGRLNESIANSSICLSGLLEFDLTDEEAFFILGHTGSYSSWVNGPLRYGSELDTYCKQFFADRLDNVLNKIPSFNDNYVYRMDSPDGSKEQILKWFKKNVGAIIQIPFFLSTSKENWENTEVIWRIKTLKSGSKGKDLTLLTNNRSESEVLFKMNSYFKILDFEITNGIVEMEEIEKSTSGIKLIGLYFEK